MIYLILAWKNLATPNRLENQMILYSETDLFSRHAAGSVKTSWNTNDFVQNVKFTLLVALGIAEPS